MAVTSENVRPTKIEKAETPKVTDAASELEEAAKKVEELTNQITGGKTILKMERDNISFKTRLGVTFTKEAPYQAVEEDELEELLRQNFRKAYPDEIIKYYEK